MERTALLDRHPGSRGELGPATGMVRGTNSGGSEPGRMDKEMTWLRRCLPIVLQVRRASGKIRSLERWTHLLLSCSASLSGGRSPLPGPCPSKLRTQSPNTSRNRLKDLSFGVFGARRSLGSSGLHPLTGCTGQSRSPSNCGRDPSKRRQSLPPEMAESEPLWLDATENEGVYRSRRWTSPTAMRSCGCSSTSDTTSATRWSSSVSWSWFMRCAVDPASPRRHTACT
jgi:hypothetical protein